MKEADLSYRLSLINEIERNMWEAWSNYGRAPGCDLHDEEDAIWFETPLPIIPYNGVFRFRVSDNAHSRINTIAERFRNRNVAFMWICPSFLSAPGPAFSTERTWLEGCGTDLRHG